MKTAIMILTLQLLAAMKIFIVYLGADAFYSYFNAVNSLVIVVYAIIASATLVIFLKGQNENEAKNK